MELINTDEVLNINFYVDLIKQHLNECFSNSFVISKSNGLLPPIYSPVLEVITFLAFSSGLIGLFRLARKRKIFV